MCTFFTRRRRFVVVRGLLHFTVPRPAQAGAWGPQISIGLLILWCSRDIGGPGAASSLRITWPWRGEPLLVLRWAGSAVPARWGWHYGDLWLGRIVVRTLAPRFVLGSLVRLFTHGSA